MKQHQIELRELDDTLKLVKPIPILIEDYGDEVHATFVPVGAYGAGVDEASAISNLRGELKALYFELKDTKSKELGKLPQQWKKTLLRILKEVKI